MSKKLAAGTDAIVLDVTVGDGAFMKNKESALELARSMVDIGKKADKKIAAFLTNMDEPLGFAVGNDLEVIEAINALKGQGPSDLMEVVYALGSLYSYLLESYDAINDDDSIYKLADSAPNDAIYDLISGYIVLPPTFSHTGGTYDEDIYLDFTTNDNNQVFYTLNGKNPTSAGKLYKKSIKISEGTTWC